MVDVDDGNQKYCISIYTTKHSNNIIYCEEPFIVAYRLDIFCILYGYDRALDIIFELTLIEMAHCD